MLKIAYFLLSPYALLFWENKKGSDLVRQVTFTTDMH